MFWGLVLLPSLGVFVLMLTDMPVRAWQQSASKLEPSEYYTCYDLLVGTHGAFGLSYLFFLI